MTRVSELCVFFFLMLLLGSCKEKIHTSVSEEKLEDILFDLSLSDRILQRYAPLERDSVRAILTESLLKIHDLDRSELDTILYLYLRNFEITEKSLKKTIERTKELQETLESK